MKNRYESTPEWLIDIERTIYTDEIFGKIGRMLYVACRFESYCRTASSILQMKCNINLLDNEKDFNEFIKGLEKKWLGENVKIIKKMVDFQMIKKYLTDAKNSRNKLVHSFTLGLEKVFCDLENEKKLEDEVVRLTREIVTGEYYAIFILCVLTKEQFPDVSYIDENVKWILTN